MNKPKGKHIDPKKRLHMKWSRFFAVVDQKIEYRTSYLYNKRREFNFCFQQACYRKANAIERHTPGDMAM